MIVGLSAATIQGAVVSTQDVDLWFRDLSDPQIQEAIEAQGGAYIPPMPQFQNPPSFAGEDFEFLDIVTHLSGLKSFDEEYQNAITEEIEGIPVKILPLERIFLSKKTAGRAKDKAALPALEVALKIQREK